MRVFTRVAMRVFTRVVTRAATGALTLGVVEGVEELATMAFLVVFRLLSSDFLWILNVGLLAVLNLIFRDCYGPSSLKQRWFQTA